MALNFNTSPYFDDFDPAKNFHRILFKPGVAVQARELTQTQSILQDQITKFADNIFKQNSPVTGGQVTTNLNCFYVKLLPSYNNVTLDVTQFDGKLIQNSTGTVLAKVIAVSPATSETSGDPDTIVVTYKSGIQFSDGDVIYDTGSNLSAQAILSDATGKSSVSSIDQGVFYVSNITNRDDGTKLSSGNFVQVNPQTTILSKYSNTPNVRVGLTIGESILNFTEDSSLLDPAVGSSNYQAPGADRYQITLTLETRPLVFGSDEHFIELVRIENGNVGRMVDDSVYSVIGDYFAKRDYETNGDYVVNDFKLTPRANTSNDSTYIMSVGKGLAYVHGYRLETETPIDIESNRARTTDSQTNTPVFMDFGSYFYVDNVNGANGYFFDVTTEQQVDFHCVDRNSINPNTANTYNSTVAATGYIRGLVYDYSTNDANTSTYVYKAYVHDLQNNVLSANVVSAYSSNITLPSTYSSTSNAYYGVTVAIVSGTDAGDFRTITNYNGSTKVATINQPWTVTPDSNSIFALIFGTGDIESVIAANKTSYPASIIGRAAINPLSKSGNLATGATQLQNPTVPEMIWNVGSPYVATLTGTSYTTQQEFRNVDFTSTGSGVSAQLNYEGSYTDVIRHFGTPNSTLSDDVVKQNYTVVVTDKKSTSLNVGDIIPWTTSLGKTVSIDNDSSIATFTANGVGSFTATIVAKVFVVNGDNTGYILKGKNKITANTKTIYTSGTQVDTYTFVDDRALVSSGQVYIQNAGLKSNGVKQSLYLSDVKSVAYVIDTLNPSTAPTLAMLTDMRYNVTNNYTFDSGQRDSYYDHASITLRPGAPKPKGNILVLLQYYQHTGGDGYFSAESYIHTGVSSLPEDYRYIPSYTSKNGTAYKLSDCVDFRPARLNAQSSFVFRYAHPAETRHGTLLPVDLTTFTGDYSYYLGRKDLLVVTKDSTVRIIEGTPALQPTIPTQPDGSLVIANLIHDPYTAFIPTEASPFSYPNLSIAKVQHKRYTMQDIAGLESRINQIEYYTALNNLEQKASSQQISDTYGLNRFKNGILTDDFSSYATADTYSSDYQTTINRRLKKMTASQVVDNYPLKSLALVYNMNRPSQQTSNTLGYFIGKSDYVNYYTLPFSANTVITQQIASRTVNLNPFATPIFDGTLSLSPNVDNWVDREELPALLVTDPKINVFRAADNYSTFYVGDWQSIPGTEETSVSSSTSSSTSVLWQQQNHTGENWWEGADLRDSGLGNSAQGDNTGIGVQVNQTTSTTTTTYTTTVQQSQELVSGYWSSIGNTYSMSNGYITDISILPYMRSQQVAFRTKGLLINTLLSATFDGTDVTKYIRKPNVIELQNVSGTFNENDVIGCYTGGQYTITGVVSSVHSYDSNTNVRLYVTGDLNTANYATTGIIQNGFFDTSGNYQTNTAAGRIASTQHNAGYVANVITSNTITLSTLASNTNNYYVGNTLYIVAGPHAGSQATIIGYNGPTKTANLDSNMTVSIGDPYSIGPVKSDESGICSGIFNIPSATFHTGERIFRLDNSVNNNKSTATTFAEAVFYAQGLSAKSQQIDFAASPSGAKNTTTQINYRRVVSNQYSTTDTNSWLSVCPYDPVAQTFIVDKLNYPNGVFLSSVKFFFRTKPTTDNAPVTLSIVGTLNGYPNGVSLDNSVVTVSKDKINISETPHYLDPTTYTEFTFDVPVYIQPNVLYSFVMRSTSSEYNLWTAAFNDTAVASSVKNNYTDPTPSVITKISSSPYVGSLFISQNSQTWTADQNQSLMFVANRCVFDTTVTPTVEFVVPRNMPQRTIIDQSVDYYNQSNAISNTITSISYTDHKYDALNLTTTDFIPSSASINYSYNSTLSDGSAAGMSYVTPGKYGTTTYDNIYLSDGKGERVLVANSNTSLSMFAQLSTIDNAVSPIISDAGVTAFTIKWNINNCELSNSLISINNAGSGYSNVNTSITVSAPTGTGGVQAYAAANVTNGEIVEVYFTEPGSGYIQTPTITVTDSSPVSPGNNAVVTITGETSRAGGPGLAKYVTKKVVLAAGFDSGDLNVFLTAYRPVNTNINVYYKILNRNDTQDFGDGNWQLMTMTNSGSSVYSSTRDDMFEYSFAPGTSGTDQGYVAYVSTNGQVYNTFSQFAIKVVLTTTDNTYVPFLTDIRAIALPANVNTTF